MKSLGERFEAKAGWTLATGSKPEVDRLLKALGNFSSGRENHQNAILVIDGATGEGAPGRWNRDPRGGRQGDAIGL